MQTVMTFDDKGFGRFLMPLFSAFEVFTVSTFCFNPLGIIPGVPYAAVVRAVAETIAQETELRLPSQQLFFAEAMKLYNALGRPPVLTEVLAGLKRLNFMALDRRRRSAESLIVRLENLIQTFPCICSVNSIPINVLANTDCSIEMRGVPLEAKRFLYGVVLRHVYLYQEALTLSGRARGTVIIVVDEGSSIFRWSANAVDNAFDAMLTYAREYGMRLIIATQYAGNRMLAKSVIANTPLKIVLPMSNAADYPVVGKEINANDEEQAYMAKRREVGKGFAFDPQVNGRFEYIFPNTTFLKNYAVTDEYVDERGLAYLLSLGIDPSAESESAKEHSSAPKSSSEGRAKEPKPNACVSEEAEDLLRRCAEREIAALAPKGDVFSLLRGMGGIFADLQISSGQKKRHLSKELEEAGFIVQHKTRVGRSTISAVEITKTAWAFIELTAPKLQGKAGWFGRVIALCVKRAMEALFYEVQIEGRLQYAPGKYKAVDDLCRKDGKTLAIEVVDTDPHYSAENARKDLLAGVDKVIFTAPTGKILNLVKQNIKSATDLDCTRIEFKPLGDFIS